tara:strand:+ start:117 stop:326 length:210 start_codon:yes stop_codon:yes gene_type:complete
MTIKKLKTQKNKNYLNYLINNMPYRAYTISDLPSKFGSDKVTDWFAIHSTGHGHGGLVLISEDYFPTWN